MGIHFFFSYRSDCVRTRRSSRSLDPVLLLFEPFVPLLGKSSETCRQCLCSILELVFFYKKKRDTGIGKLGFESLHKIVSRGNTSPVATKWRLIINFKTINYIKSHLMILSVYVFFIYEEYSE